MIDRNILVFHLYKKNCCQSYDTSLQKRTQVDGKKKRLIHVNMDHNRFKIDFDFLFDDSYLVDSALAQWTLPSYGWFGKTVFTVISTFTIGVSLFYNFLIIRVAMRTSMPFNAMLTIDSLEKLIGVMCLEFKLASWVWDFSIVDFLGHTGCWCGLHLCNRICL